MTDPVMVGKPKMPAAKTANTTQPVAPSAAPLTPMQRIASLMDSNSYTILLGLMNWAGLFQTMHNASVSEAEEGPKMTDDYFKCMLTPFTGFGANPMVWQNMSHALVPQIMSVVLQWRSDEVYRQANTMTWLMLQTAAPTLANIDKGWEAASDVYKILAELKKIEDA